MGALLQSIDIIISYLTVYLISFLFRVFVLEVSPFQSVRKYCPQQLKMENLYLRASFGFF
jgi:hypothetical protein